MEFIKGMDVSMIKSLEMMGASYYLDGEQGDLFLILRRCGANMVRLRVWLDPYDETSKPYGGGINDLATTAELAARAKENRLDLALDFHYSDFWADPAKQIKPKTWGDLSGEALRTAVYLHTADTLKFLKNRGVVPGMVQIGNEITNGLLWPDGHVEHPGEMAALLSAGITAVRRECPEAKIVLHLDFGTNRELYDRWFENVEPFHLDYDVIGMSFYPHWNGEIDLLRENMDHVSGRFDKDVAVMETSIAYTTDSLGCKGVVFTKDLEAKTGYPATQDGQAMFLRDLCRAVRSVKGGRGLGVFYWEPAWLPIPHCTWANPNGCAYLHDTVEAGNSMANQALFDAQGNANLALVNLKAM